MNAPIHPPLDLEAAAPAGNRASFGEAPTPGDLAITVRDRRFGRGGSATRWWLNGDPVATAWHNALSATFPRGEAFFIESVRAHREGAPPKLAEEIRAFTQQEVNHSREHLAFNRAAAAQGYELGRIEAHVQEMLDLAKDRPQIVNLAATMALEHYTAMMAHLMLADPRLFAGGDPELTEMWRWHAVEEIEHKGVAYDTFLHATQGWSRWRRWKLKAIMMLVITRNFIPHRIRDTLDLLAQDGITGFAARRRVIWYLFGRPGVLRRLIPAWIAYFLPGFHPWNHDDRALIAGR
ncbi:MAG: metal-dependent hydrolase [Novosphingobium sp.]